LKYSIIKSLTLLEKESFELVKIPMNHILSLYNGEFYDSNPIEALIIKKMTIFFSNCKEKIDELLELLNDLEILIENNRVYTRDGLLTEQYKIPNQMDLNLVNSNSLDQSVLFKSSDNVRENSDSYGVFFSSKSKIDGLGISILNAIISGESSKQFEERFQMPTKKAICSVLFLSFKTG
jgi:hypothetical protein